MTIRLTAARLSTLRTAAEVGIRMSGLQPHTVQVKPEELAAMVEEITAARAPATRDPVAEIARDLKDGSTYRLSVAEACVVLTLSHPDAALEPVEIVRLRADLDAVASSIGVTRG